MPALGCLSTFTITLLAFLPAVEYRKEQAGKKMRRDNQRSLKRALDRYRAPPPHVIEVASVTLLIGYSSALSRTGGAASNLLIAVLAELSRFVLC